MDIVFSFTASHAENSCGFEEQCKRPGMVVQYSSIFGKVLVDFRDESWVDGKLVALRFGFGEFLGTFERLLALPCPFGSHTLEFHVLDRLVEDLERFESIPTTDARPFEHFSVLIKQSYGTTSRRLSTQLHETVQDMSSTARGVQKAGHRRETTRYAEAVVKNRKRLETEG